MKMLVTYYSRTANTKSVAVEIQKELKCDIDEIIDQRDRAGAKGWLGAGRDASRKLLTEIKVKKDPAEYDLVIIGTPVWAWTVTPAVRTYLSAHKLKKVAFFCTCGGSGIETTFREMERLSKKPVATLGLPTKGWTRKLDKETVRQKIEEFSAQIGKSAKR
jgi:flavodoxin